MDCKNPNSATCADGAQSPENSIDVDALNDRNMLIGLEPMPNNAQFDNESETDLYTPRVKSDGMEPPNVEEALTDGLRYLVESYEGDNADDLDAAEAEPKTPVEILDGLAGTINYIIDNRGITKKAQILNEVTRRLMDYTGALYLILEEYGDITRADC